MRFFIVFIMLLLSLHSSGQEVEENSDLSNPESDAMQNFADLSSDREDELHELSRHPINLNLAGVELLETLPYISALEIDQLIKYRRTMGLLLSVYELQCIPGWSVDLCRRLHPYVTVILPRAPFSFRDMSQQLLLRAGTKDLLGNKDSTLHYQGSMLSTSLKYSISGQNWLGGFSGEKDAGENFMKRSNSHGFDHYSFYFSFKQSGPFSGITIGDYTINLGQGLVCWMNYGFGKSTEISQIKRQAPVTKPYKAGGEGKYFRGAVITMKRKAWEYVFFASYRKLDAHLYQDSIHSLTHYSSIQTSGLHRTIGEIRDKGTVGSFISGGRVKWVWGKGNVALQGIYSQNQFQRLVSAIPYRLYEKAGRGGCVVSADHSFTYKNLHVFGEAALSGRFPAFIEGLLIALAPGLDGSLLFRHIHPGYVGIYGNVVAEQADPGNERGIYAALAYRVNNSFTIRLFTDKYASPWLRYRISVPATGTESGAELRYDFSRKANLVMHFRIEEGVAGIQKSGNLGVVDQICRVNNRFQAEFPVNTHIRVKMRTDWNVIQHIDNESNNKGYSFLVDVDYSPDKRRWKLNGRVQTYDTDSYDSRIYAFERGAQGVSYLGSYYGSGTRLYVNFKYDVNVALCGWIKIGHSSFPLIPNPDPANPTGSESGKLDFQLAILQKF